MFSPFLSRFVSVSSAWDCYAHRENKRYKRNQSAPELSAARFSMWGKLAWRVLVSFWPTVPRTAIKLVLWHHLIATEYMPMVGLPIRITIPIGPLPTRATPTRITTNRLNQSLRQIPVWWDRRTAHGAEGWGGGGAGAPVEFVRIAIFGQKIYVVFGRKHLIFVHLMRNRSVDQGASEGSEETKQTRALFALWEPSDAPAIDVFRWWLIWPNGH